MTRPLSKVLLLALTCATFPACSVFGPTKEDAPELVSEAKRKEQEDLRRRNFQSTLIRIDQLLASYVQALANRGDPRADRVAEQSARKLTEEVLDERKIYRVGKRPDDAPPGENYRRLQALAVDGSVPDRQAIALSALGFSGRREVMPTIVQGAMLDDQFLVDHAVLGLAILRAPDTPPGVLAAIVENDRHNEEGRVQAAWALYQIQTASPDPKAILDLWQRFLTTKRDTVPGGVLVQSVRGLGLTGDAQHGKLVSDYLDHPTPRVRMAAAIAIGRMNAQDYWPQLLDLLGTGETVQNVRLHARKSLAALAGNKDYGYDVQAWRKVFDRGQK